jgi:acyl-coenzyme A synthetase/AMP-(fatty) acid ligase
MYSPMTRTRSLVAGGALSPPSHFNFVTDVLWPRAQAIPDATAIIGVGRNGEVERWTYERVTQAVGNLAAALVERGIGQGDRILLLMPRTPLWQLVMSACLYIGAIPVPCVTQSSPGEVRYRALTVGARGAITSAELVERFAEFQDSLGVRLARHGAPGWETLESLIGLNRSAPPAATLSADTPALIYFTSGSSGMPKAVVHAARGVHARAWQPWYQLGTGPKDVIWSTSDTGWTRAGSCLLFGPWMYGAAALIVDGSLTPGRKLDLIAQHRVSIFGAVATELRQIMSEAVARSLPSLRWTLSAGEAMTAELSDAWRAFSGTPLVVGYGQTETPTSTLTDPQAEAVNGMIGAPMAGNAVTVLDKHGQPALPGALGEIAFAGSHPGLMLGYWREGRIVAEFGRDGWHMTGDTGYLDEDGCLFFIGRSDDIISSSGYRIGPTEVENALSRHPAVQECAVAASPDAERGEVVKAFVVLQDGCSGSSELVRALQDFVKQEIAPFKYPRRIEFVAELPRTSSGKISRRLLREAEFAGVSA